MKGIFDDSNSRKKTRKRIIMTTTLQLQAGSYDAAQRFALRTGAGKLAPWRDSKAPGWPNIVVL